MKSRSARSDTRSVTGRSPQPGRGSDRLLDHVIAIDNAEEMRLPARDRLERAMGFELARMLVRALSRARDTARAA